MYTKILSDIIQLGTVDFVFLFSKKKKDEFEAEEEYKHSLLCRFVLDGLGKKVGESVAIDEDILIIKSRGRYLGVPLKHIEEDGKTLLVKGLVDLSNAERMGERWRQESFNKIHYDKGE